MTVPVGTGGYGQPTVSRRPRRRKPGTFYPVNKGLGTSATPAPSPSDVQPAPAGPPVDPMLEAQKAAANLTIGLGDAFDTYKTGTLTTEYGNLDDPNSDLASNPYSRAAMLQRSYNNAKRQSLNSYAAQGQLYAGSYQNKTEADREGYDQGLDHLRKGKQSALDELLMGKLDRYSQVGAGVNQDTLNAILKALGAV